jgi:hypothetical protein
MRWLHRGMAMPEREIRSPGPALRSPLSAEQDLRKMVRGHCGALGRATLDQALQMTSDHYRKVRDFETDGDDGDGFVVYEDVTNHGRGTRLEVGMVRVFCLRDDMATSGLRPALRLRLRCCYRFDHAIVSEVLAEPTWSLHCWNPVDLQGVLSSAREKAAFKVLAGRQAAAVSISTESTFYRLAAKNPRPDAKQMWWGVWDVASTG